MTKSINDVPVMQSGEFLREYGDVMVTRVPHNIPGMAAWAWQACLDDGRAINIISQVRHKPTPTEVSMTKLCYELAAIGGGLFSSSDDGADMLVGVVFQ